jgi:hypothetical protein
MPQKIMVVKPFVYTLPPKHKREKLATEVKIVPNKDPVTKEWAPTELEIDDEMASHPWIKDDFADGCIERPEVTKARIDALDEKHKKEVQEAQVVIKQAEAALARAGSRTKTDAEHKSDLERDLNTPVNQLRSDRGSDIDQPIGTVPVKAKK